MAKVRADIRDIVLKYGTKNVHVLMECDRVHTVGIISYSSSLDLPVTTICTIDESRYNVTDGYKVTLVPPKDSELRKKHFYQSDFNQFLKNGSVKILIDIMNI